MSGDAAPERLEVGSIGRPHGIHGEVIVRLTTDRTERVEAGTTLFAGDRPVVIIRSRPHQRGWIVAFEGLRHRDQAEELRGATLFAEPIEDPDAIWVHDLIGCAVVEVDGTPRGLVESVQENPASDLLVTDAGDLVPLTFLVEQRDDTLVIDPPLGLFELRESGTAQD